MIEIGAKICADFASSASREWLETNGIGGYASGTISGAHTRRYHGMLTAATRPPVGRFAMLSKVEDTVVVDGTVYHISANQYPGAVHPQGYEYLKSFRLDPFPVWTYLLGELELVKKVFMVHGENATVITWTVKAFDTDDDRNIGLELRPLISLRDHHHLRHAVADDEPVYRNSGSELVIRQRGYPSLHIHHHATQCIKTGHWYRDLEYPIEKERGFDFHEDLYQPCLLKFDLRKPVAIVATDGSYEATDTGVLEKREMKRRAAIVAKAGPSDNLTRDLRLAADQFIVKRGAGNTVIAGYPWFSDWGRDTMIALPGLALATNRPDVAKSILIEFSRHISEGMIPNRFPDEGEVPDLNTVDATLWYFEAIRAYIEKTGDTALLRDRLYAPLLKIIDRHITGTRYRIKMDTDGMLYAGEPGVQLTWMDAKVGDSVITPRTGKAVEIQALWYNALFIVSGWARLLDDADTADRLRTIADRCRSSFNDQFWNEADQCLYDVIDSQKRDPSVRPNQIFAVSLHHSMLSAEKARMVVDKVGDELLTPYGLRTLSPKDPRYVPTYNGSPEERDSAYHQGTVWTWLLGPFIVAYNRTHSNDARAKQLIDELREAMGRHLEEACLGQISEIFDAEPPHLPRGAPAQAWSVAEVLRVMGQ